MAEFNDSSSDDEFFYIVGTYIDMNLPRRPRLFRDRSNPMTEYSDEEFSMRLRLSKESVLELLQQVEPRLQQRGRRRLGQLSPIHQLLIALRFYSSGSFQIAVADLAGVSIPTVCIVIKRVSHAIAQLYQQHVHFPGSREERMQAMSDFHAIANFPGVLGAIDCTHVPIQSPGGDNGEIYRNRKGYFSLNIQAVVSAQLVFLNVVSRWPGSVHDATIFNHSRLCARFESGDIRLGYLLGDAGYPCKAYLLTPLAVPRTPAEQSYNAAQVRTRNPVERAFGVLKRRFPCLRMGLRVKVERACEIVVACCVLHNICMQRGDVNPPDDHFLIGGRHVYEDVPTAAYNRIHAGGATVTRTALINNNFA